MFKTSIQYFFVSPTSISLVGILIKIDDVTDIFAIERQEEEQHKRDIDINQLHL